MRHEDLRRFTADADLQLNDRDIRLVGTGTIDPEAGIVVGDYVIENLPHDIDPLVFKTVLITGYPSVCESPPGANPFKVGSYRYRRRVDFGDRGWLAYTAVCESLGEAHDKRLESRFDVEGRLDIPALAPAGEVVETWVPHGDQIAGSFTIAWPTRSGRDSIVGQASTIYELPTGAANIGEVRHRSIRFTEASGSASGLHVVQHSRLL